MKIYLILFLIGCSFILKAQNSAVSDSIAEPGTDKMKVYIAPGYSNNQFAGTTASLVEIQAGLTYNRHIDIGVSYSVVLDNFQKQIIFPTVHNYDQKNLGIRAQYLFLKKRFHLHAGLGYQFIDARWSPEEDKDETFVDHMNFLEVFGGLSYEISNTFALQADAGYNFANGLDLVGFVQSDLEGFKASIKLKISIFGF